MYKSWPRDPILGQKVWPMEGKMEHYLFINRSLSWYIWEIKENTAWQIIHTVAIYKNWTYHCVNIQREGVIYSNIILSIDFWPWKRWFWKRIRTESHGRPSEDVSSPSSWHWNCIGAQQDAQQDARKIRRGFTAEIGTKDLYSSLIPSSWARNHSAR